MSQIFWCMLSASLAMASLSHFLALDAVETTISVAARSTIQRRPQPPTPQSKPKVQTPATSKPNWLQEPFDPSLASLPTGFAGHDVQALCVALQQRTPVKDEFETTAAFNSRVREAAASPIVG